MKNALTPTVHAVALALAEGLDTPRSLAVSLLIKNREWDQLVSLRVDPLTYNDPEDYFRDRAISDLLRKFPEFELEIDPEAAAIEKWWAAERDCYKANERLQPLLNGGPFGGIYPNEISEFVQNARKVVVELIGDGPPNTWEGKFGPGATVSDISRYATIPDKMSSTPTLTSNAWPFLVPWTGTAWAKASAALERTPSFVRGNVYFSVPKDATTKRGCAKGPSINVFYQLGLGRILKNRLRSAGLDLRKGQAIHRQVVCRASKDASLATIDLSSASDTVCKNLVELLLPRRWFNLLNTLREPFTFIQGKWVKLEKISAMGNGFTFELESVLFAAICMAACRMKPSFGVDLFVYGDDLIVPNEFAPDVISALKFFGFTPNPRKSFSEGYFRESCGGDFFDGVSVRPYSLKEDINEPQQLISLANGIRRLATQVASDPIRYADRSDRTRRAWFKCLDFIPSTIRACRGPSDLGDLVIHDDETKWVTRWRANGIRYLRVYRPARFKRIRWNGFSYDVQFATALYLAGKATETKFLGHNDTFVPRDGVIGYKVGWAPYS